MVVYRGTISPDAIGNPMCQYGRNEMNRRHPLRKGRGFFVRWRRRRRWIYENVTYYRLVGLRRRCLYIYSRGLRDGVFVVHHTHSHTQWWWWRKATHTHKNPELDFRLRDFFGARQPESHLPPQSCMARCAVAKCGRRRPLARLFLPPKSFKYKNKRRDAPNGRV